MTSADESQPTLPRPRSSTASRVVYGVFGLFVVVFIVASTAQIALPLFRGADRAHAEPVPEPCATELRRLVGAADRAVLRASGAPDGAAARASFRAALAPEWDDEPAVASRCSGSPAGTDAHAAVVRLARALEAHVVRGAEGTTALRRDVDARLPAPAGSAGP
jgi:hypothetical protein